MPLKHLPILTLVLLAGLKLNAQCSTLGQTPQTAFPVCGTKTFHQNSVPICYNAVVPVPGCVGDGVTYYDTNPFWYQFTCYSSGSLDFLITPNNLGDDYDWQIFDITNVTDLNQVYTDTSLFVVGNWSGSYGKTGAQQGATSPIECASNPASNETTFSTPPQLIAGHTYLLLVSHYTQTQSGYSLSFNGGTAIITDTTKPAFKNAIASCDGTQINLLVNKQVQCSSLAANGSDFVISSGGDTIVSAVSTVCTASFDMNSVLITLSHELPPGNYSLIAQIGTDSNTLVDNCDNEIPVGDSVPFKVFPKGPTQFDSITPIGCAPKTLQLVFDPPIACSSIADDGSDFVVTGPQPVTIQSASGSCDANGITSTVTITLASPIVTAGTYQVKLVVGSDSNTIINQCNYATPAGSTLNFVAFDTVSAAINLTENLGCTRDTIYFSNSGGNGIYAWQWLFNDGVTDTTENVTRIYDTSGTESVSLAVSNGVCADTSSQTFILPTMVKAAFITTPPIICPNDEVEFIDSSAGPVTAWNWYFGNGNTSDIQKPPLQTYNPGTEAKYFSARLIVSNSGCADTAYKILQVLYDCYIAVPSGFTPNGDGLNDYLYPLNAYKAVNLKFLVYNRWGQKVFETENWQHKWDGTINGVAQPSGTYVWSLSYTDVDTGKKHFSKGTTVLIR